jgi:hypothetical protein
VGDKLFNVLGSIVILAIVTTLVLPGRQTVGVINASGNAFSGGLRAAMGG